MSPELLLLQSPRPPQDNSQMEFRDALGRKAYAVGRALQEVGREPGLGKNERLVALVMYLDVVTNDTLPDLSRVTALGQLSEAATVKAIQKLTIAGFIKVVRDRRAPLYEVQFPNGCDLS